MVTIYNVNKDEQYLYNDDSYTAMQKMLYCLNIVALDKNAKVTETKFGYHLAHKKGEFWVRK